MICVRCLGVVARDCDVVKLIRHGISWDRCADTTACDRRLARTQRDHQTEIERRKKHLKPGEKLVVLYDGFGHEYGYGSQYYTVSGDAEAFGKKAVASAIEHDGLPDFYYEVVE